MSVSGNLPREIAPWPVDPTEDQQFEFAHTFMLLASEYAPVITERQSITAEVALPESGPLSRLFAIIEKRVVRDRAGEIIDTHSHLELASDFEGGAGEAEEVANALAFYGPPDPAELRKIGGMLERFRRHLTTREYTWWRTAFARLSAPAGQVDSLEVIEPLFQATLYPVAESTELAISQAFANGMRIRGRWCSGNGQFWEGLKSGAAISWLTINGIGAAFGYSESVDKATGERAVKLLVPGSGGRLVGCDRLPELTAAIDAALAAGPATPETT